MNTVPIEAKVVLTPNALAEYLKDVRNKFIAGIAAPIVGEGAMIGYLLSGDDGEFFDELGGEMKLSFMTMPKFRDRPHRTSEHARNSRPDLRLHHMAMRLGRSLAA
jgi:hypothetical protein